METVEFVGGPHDGRVCEQGGLLRTSPPVREDDDSDILDNLNPPKELPPRLVVPTWSFRGAMYELIDGRYRFKEYK